MKLILKGKVFYIVIFVLIIYTLLFLKFLIDINKQYELKNEDSDIVVLTGGIGRIKTGIELIGVMKNSRLLISGVGSGVRLSDIIDNSEKFVHKIDLGYSASSTIGNALEAKKWVQKHDIKKIILITNNWHLPRSRLLFKSAMPEVKIMLYPVAFNEEYKKLNKFFPKNMFFLIHEHFKYIVSHFQALMLRIGIID